MTRKLFLQKLIVFTGEAKAVFHDQETVPTKTDCVLTVTVLPWCSSGLVSSSTTVS